MQKIILIALLATCAIAAQTNVYKADASAAMVGTADGFVVSMGVIQKCHITCATCDGPLITNCLTCHAADGAALAMTVSAAADATKGKCGCWTGATNQHSASNSKPFCETTTPNVAITTALCTLTGPWFKGTTACEMCGEKLKQCTAVGTVAVGAAGVNCWANVANAAADTCDYVEATATFIHGDNHPYAQGTVTTTASVVNGYFYTTADKQHTACAKGCISCTSATAGCTCATGFTIVGTTQACECAAEGNFSTAASATAVDLCTACGTGCKTCSSATVCTVCDSSHQLGSTTSSSSTCESLADTSATTSTDDTTTTSGTADGETSATATATNGVLITAASMLLAVILA